MPETERFTIYSKDPCVQCDATYRAFSKAGIEKDTDYRVVDVGDPANAEHLEYIKSLGYQQAPVVVVDDEQHWSGFRPDRVKAVAAARAAAAAPRDVVDQAPFHQRAPVNAARSLGDRTRALRATTTAQRPRSEAMAFTAAPTVARTAPSVHL